MTQDTAAPPHIPTGQELYDALMGNIEPELTSQGSLALEQTYQNETPEDREQRLNRYDLAFDRYEQAETEYLAMLQEQVNRYKREASTRAEMDSRESDENVLGSLLQSFQSA